MKDEKTIKPEQDLAINSDGGNMLVSASAGSGKTFVMIKRIVRLITSHKAHVDEILAATFTEAAAADMKGKLKRALTEEIEKGNVALADEMARISVADVCTLHSFCGRLVRTYFFAAGVSPDYKVADESEAQALKQDALEETFKSFYDEKDEKFLAFIDRYRVKRKDKTLKEIIMKAYDFGEAEVDPDRLLLSFRDNYTESGAERFLKDYETRLNAALETVFCEISALKDACGAAGVLSYEKYCGTLCDIVREIQGGGLSVAQNFAESHALPSVPSDKTEGAKAFKERVKDVKNRLKDLCDYSAKIDYDTTILEGLKNNAEVLYRIIKRFSERYSSLKRENDLLDFADLERFTLTALKDEDVKAAVRKKYKYVFVDEYQDVNAVQEAIVSSITDGNLFMVGDVKQSIYGFRGCRSEIFENKEKSVAANGGTYIKLNYNFRSADKVIDFVNEIFDFCYVPAYTGLDYKAVRLKSGGKYPQGAEGRAVLHHLIKRDKTKDESALPHIYNILDEALKPEEKESANIANLLAEIIDDELQQKFYDVKEETFRRVTRKDIAVLTRAGENNDYVKGIVEGLRARGIPVASGVAQNVCDFPEIKTLINLLKLLDCFIQDAPLVATLLSPFGGFTEEDLLSVALFFNDNNAGARKGFYDAFSYYITNADTSLKDKIVAFRDKIEKYRALADFKGAKGVLDMMIADSGYENYLLCTDDGKEKIRRLYKFLSEVESGGRPRTIKEFLHKIETSPKSFECAGGGEEDAVKVMTIHASKGLEFPVVIVCGLERSFNRQDESKKILFDRDKGLFEYAYDDEKRTFSKTFYREMVKTAIRENQIKEEMRLFYVALTRAAYSLHVVFETKTDERKGEFSKLFNESASFLDFIPESIPAKEENPESFGLITKTRKRTKVFISKVDEAAMAKMKQDFAFVYPFSAETVLPLKNSVSAALRSEREETKPLYEVRDAGDTGIDRGIIAHKILEHYDFNGEFDEQIKFMTESGVLTTEELDKVDTDKLRKVIQSGVFDGLKDKTLYREQPFLVNIAANRVFDTRSTEDVLLQGVIDLLAIDGDTAEIVDYKYSVLGGESLKAKYAAQLNLYAYAAERALKVKVVSKTLVNVFTGETVTIS